MKHGLGQGGRARSGGAPRGAALARTRQKGVPAAVHGCQVRYWQWQSSPGGTGRQGIQLAAAATPVAEMRG